MCCGRIFAVLALTSSLVACAESRVASARDPVGCPSDLRLLLGACVAPHVAEEACGSTARTTLDGCVARAPCGAGSARDLVSGACLPRRDVRELASSVGVLAEEYTLLECPDGGVLASASIEDTPHLACLAPEPLEPRAVRCGVGSVSDGASCRSVVLPGGRVDVITWLRAAIGPDGGEGAAPLCGALRRSPGVLVSSAEVLVRVDLAFPDNDVTQVVAAVRGTGAGTAELERVVAPLVEALRALGGTANQAAIGTAVRCQRTAERPRAASPVPGDDALQPNPQIR